MHNRSEIKTITSLANQQIKDTVRLHSSKGRKELKRFIAEGIRTIETFLEAGWKPITVFTTKDHLQHIKKLLPKEFHEVITIVSDPIMKKISTVTTPSGVLALLPIKDEPTVAKLGPGLVCAGIADPGNLGTLIRTTAAMDKKTVVLIDGVDPWSPKVVQASAGALAYINIFRLSWEQLVKHKGSLKLCALVVKDGKQPNQVDLSDSLIVVGSEAHGIPQKWIEDCEYLITLAMSGKIESLNAAVAGSIILYLSFKQD